MSSIVRISHCFAIAVFLFPQNAMGQGSSNAGFEPIFDGKSLDGWHLQKEPRDDRYRADKDNFFVKDGILHCRQLEDRHGGLLLTDRTYSDFELRLEIKSDWGCDSGIFFHCNEQGQGIQILNDYLEDGCIGFPFGQGTGAYISRPIMLNKVKRKKNERIRARDVYDAVAIDGLTHAIGATGWNKSWKRDDWNSLTIRCVGDEPVITTWINDVKVMQMDGSTYQGRSLKDEKKQNWAADSSWDAENVRAITGGQGSIGLQIHPGARWKAGGAAMYRNIRIKDLTNASKAESSHSSNNKSETKHSFPYAVTDETPKRKLSSALRRSFDDYSSPRPQDNELYSQFKYTKLNGFDYHNGDGTISRRDPSKVILENGKYYVWYTY